jgi:hypothetical protein
MIDSVGGSTNLPTVQRANLPVAAVRPRSAALLTAIQQIDGRASDAKTPVVKIFAVPQAKDGKMTRMPRGSLVDVLI